MSSTAELPVTKKLYPREWLEIIHLAKTGQKVATIAKKYDVHISVIYRGLKSRGVNLTLLAAEEDMKENAAKRAELVKRIEDTKDTDYRYTDFLQKEVVKLLMVAARPTAPGGSVNAAIAGTMDAVKTLKIAMDAIRGGTDNKFRLLGIDKENSQADAVLPELPIRTLTDNEVEAMRDKQGSEDELLTPEEMADAIDAAEELIRSEDDDAIIEEVTP